MAHFAKVLNNKVITVIVADDDFIESHPSDDSGKWIQTSYNTHGGIHYGDDNKPDGGIALRGNYAGMGYIYDEVNDVFYPPQPYPSWTISSPTWLWQAPIPIPDDGKKYTWNEQNQEWDQVNDTI